LTLIPITVKVGNFLAYSSDTLLRRSLSMIYDETF
jgi:hypothetical protein